MKIAIDIRAVCHRKTGKGYYTERLTRALLKIDKKNKYILYSNKKCPKFRNIKKIRGKSIFYHINLLRHLKKDRPDIFFAPTSYIVPAFAGKWLKVILTVHDLVAFIFPDSRNKKAALIERLTLKRALRKARRAICVSRNTAKDLYEKFGYAKAKTCVVYCAAGDEFGILTSRKLQNVKIKHKLPDKFILGVGTIEPRKNFAALCEAFKKIKNDFKDLHLIIVGARGWNSKEIYKSGLCERIKFLEYVESEDLVKIYNLAQIFIFPSIYEGFGMPPLEAMKCGCPVICSNTSSMPEVCGESAYMIDPHDKNAIAKAVREILNDQILRGQLKEKGLMQANKFSWEKSAQKLLKIFRDV